MKEDYRIQRAREEGRSRVTGAALTLVIHIGIAACFFFTGFTYLDPPPPEKEQILIDFEEMQPEKPKQTWDGTRPRAEVASKDINLVRKADSPIEGSKANEAPEATVDEFGDVETPEPPREKEINRRALFSAANNKTDKDTLAPQTSREPSFNLKEGHASGNTKNGNTVGEPTARLTGRTPNGTLARPAYKVQKEGKVVVEIWVDNYGQVQKAVSGAEGTTVTDKDLWNEARKAAIETSFNRSAEAPLLQKGTITYIFRLNK